MAHDQNKDDAWRVCHSGEHAQGQQLEGLALEPVDEQK